MSTLTLNLDDRHDEVLTSLAAEQDLSKTALMRQALRLYQTVHLELKRGRQLAFQNPDGSFIPMVMLGGPMAAETAPVQQEAEWLRELLRRSMGYVKEASTRYYDGTDGSATRASAASLFKKIDAALQPTQGEGGAK